MTEQTTPPSASSPDMFVRGTNEPIRVAATDTAISSSGAGAGAMRTRPVGETVIDEDGTVRRLEVEGVQVGNLVQTDSPVSYAFLPDLLKMPLEVIDTLTVLTFMTFDGAIHTYPKQGVRLYAPALFDGTVDELNTKLTFFTSMAGIEVEIGHDRAYLLTEGGSSN